MPVVTIDPNDYQRFELKTAPRDPSDPNDEDGFIMARPLPYGMVLKRRDRAAKMAMRTEGKGRNADTVLEMDSAIEASVKHDFGYCIGEHNLKDRAGNLIDFTKPMAFNLLNPRVGSEIESIITELNGDVDEDELGDFPKLSGES